ncbi:B-box zinc finger domain-containing protein [Cryptosporidium muris RN66]|uniref:B-box zinc finger domain-containing protein n=1 Tax=Cryptosporidium muris (strain RN66) TaxID=441375 RepID=B6AGH5_CRYMR|nr:B-box zinc finger domain-containing protein [Cryptosporidium muris RN66]EEA07316.1 B-box zinc finger domain-containing protein [Cryptosporidium muris RN66]|eukprot:XP_002141665.1 B-box zinc finger domain-containing protein [Cryptosporidium muris RN66]
MSEERTIQVFPELIDDAFILSRCEYRLQLSFYTPDLHVTRAWSLITRDQRESFNKYASTLGGHIIQSVFDISKLSHDQGFDSILNESVIIVNPHTMVFTNGALSPPNGFEANPSGLYRFIIFTLALGPILTVDSSDLTKTSAPFPSGYMCRTWQDPNICYVPSPNYSFSANYQVKFSEQILPTILLEIEFKPLRIEISQPLCEMCEINLSTIYCGSDKAHLCSSCDEAHHSSTRLLSKHQRVPVSQSPYQFGFCPHHSTERIDSVCMECYIPLCPHCILIGQHSSGDAAEHILISTTDAIRMAYSGSSQSDLELYKRKQQLVDYLSSRNDHINNVRCNYDEIQERIELASKNLLKQLISLRDRKVSFLMSVKRQLLTELLLIEWMEAFFAHLRLALLPSDFLVYSHRHDLVCSHFFGDISKIVVSNEVIPLWITERFFVDGGLYIESRKNEVVALLNSSCEESTEKKENSLLEKDENNTKTNTEYSKFSQSTSAKWLEFNNVDEVSVGNLDGHVAPIEQQLLTSEEYNLCELPEIYSISTKRNENIPVTCAKLKKSKLIPEAKQIVDNFDNEFSNDSIIFANDEFVTCATNIVKLKLKENNFDTNLGEESGQILLDLLYDNENGEIIDNNQRYLQERIESIFISKNRGNKMDVWNPNVIKPSKIAQVYWNDLISNHYELMIALLHTSPAMKRRQLISDFYDLAIYMQSFDHFYLSILHFEIYFLKNIPIDSLLLTSSIINDMFHIVFRSSNLFQKDRKFLSQQLQTTLSKILNLPDGPLEKFIGKKIHKQISDLNKTNINKSESNNLLTNDNIVDQHEIDYSLAKFEESILQSIEELVNQITIIELRSIPDSIHGAISFCCQALLNHYIIPRLTKVLILINNTISSDNNVLNSKITVSKNRNSNQDILEYTGVITKKDDIISRIQCYRRSISALSLYVWKSDNTPKILSISKVEASYKKLGLEIFSWLQKQMIKPRLNSPIGFNLAGMPKRGIDAVNSIRDYMIWVDNALRNQNLNPEGGMTEKDLIKCEYFERLLQISVEGYGK